MIPKEIEAKELLVEALIDGWRLQLMSTNWDGFWIIQLSRKGQLPLAMLVNLDNLASICTGLRLCIDAARNPSQYPRAKTMYQTVAGHLPTQVNDEGAISIVSEWTTEPVVLLSYYRGSARSNENVIRQGLHVDDAMELYNHLAGVYNKFPRKQDWVPRM